MKQEDKELLLKDLCARLPYGVKVEHLLHAPNNPSDLFAIDVDKQILYCDHKGREEWYKVEFVKPYLRPMSSMTEEEKEKLKSLYDAENVTNESICFLEGGTLEEYEAEISFVFCYCVVEWLLENHFDFMGLIPKGLAIEVTKENNPYK